MRTGKKAKGSTTVTTGQTQKSSGTVASPRNANSKQPQQTKSTSRPAVKLTYEQIAQRAEHIWRQEGCLPGRDDQNWREAEAQLKAELSAK